MALPIDTENVTYLSRYSMFVFLGSFKGLFSSRFLISRDSHYASSVRSESFARKSYYSKMGISFHTQ